MKLVDLDAAFIALGQDGAQRRVDTIEEAHGVMFKCPKCWQEKGGPAGVHYVMCWSRSRGVPDGVSPGPGRWALLGTGLADLTLGADPPNTASSVKLNVGCMWHGHVKRGEAR